MFQVIEKYQNERVEGDEKKSSPRQNYITSKFDYISDSI